MDNKQNMKLYRAEVKDIKPYPNNPRINDRAVNDVMESIKQCGYCAPIVVDEDYVILAGHTRHKAIKKLGWKTVEVIVKEGLTEEQKKKYRLLDNKTGELAEWNMEKLSIELEGLDFGSFDFGFGAVNDENIPTIGDDGYDVAEQESHIENRVKRGDVWQCGQHRVCCGDSTSAEDVAKLMDGEESKLLFTSPPYSDMRSYRGGKNLDVVFLANFIPTYAPYANIQAVNLGIQRKDSEIIQYWDAYIERARQAGLKLLCWNVWDKMTAGSIGNQDAVVPIRHEWIFVFGKKPVDINLTWLKKAESIKKAGTTKTKGARQVNGVDVKEVTTSGATNKAYKKMESVIDIPDQANLESVTKQRPEQGKITKEHPATFPVYLPAEYIVAFTDKGDSVVEPFGGSGTTMIACEQLGRRCYSMELDEHFASVMIDRWEQFTGGKAELVYREGQK